jgi:hypothetical protein
VNICSCQRVNAQGSESKVWRVLLLLCCCPVVVTLYMATITVYLHDVSLMLVRVEGAHGGQGRAPEPHTWHTWCPYLINRNRKAYRKRYAVQVNSVLRLVSLIGFDWAGTSCHTSDIDIVTNSDMVLHTTACCRAFAIELECVRCCNWHDSSSLANEQQKDVELMLHAFLEDNCSYLCHPDNACQHVSFDIHSCLTWNVRRVNKQHDDRPDIELSVGQYQLQDIVRSSLAFSLASTQGECSTRMHANTAKQCSTPTSIYGRLTAR